MPRWPGGARYNEAIARCISLSSGTAAADGTSVRLSEALGIIQNQTLDQPRFSVAVACGFTPLHLKTFLAAHLRLALPARNIELSTGLYGDLTGEVERLERSRVDAAAIVLEWSDLDARLGFRQTGGWGPSEIDDIICVSRKMLARLAAALKRLPETARFVLSLPTLPLPPVFHTPAWQSPDAEMRLRQALAEFGASAASLPNSVLLSEARLAESAPPGARYNFKSDVLAGFPYTLSHADALAHAAASLLAPPAPKKALITDLDDTLWKGIVGDAGVDGVSWDLPGHAQIHGLYQQLLRALADQGVLIAIASKNDPDTVQRTLARPDILLPAGKIFPVEARWTAKSSSVARILSVWNIAADSVVFVDDSPMELAEVEQAHPGIQCLRFPTGDYASAVAFLRGLRERFAKPRLTQEDSLRSASIRRNAEWQRGVEEGAAAPEGFLAELKAKITFDFETAASDPRVLDLLNKSNQFNLNGVRYAGADWPGQLQSPGSFVASVAYEDRFGPLGKIAVLRGRANGTLQVGAWVMSCRAFARRIEHQCLWMLFDRFKAGEIHFDFQPTRKNGPLQDFFESLLGHRPTGPFTLARPLFEGQCPRLYHLVIDRSAERMLPPGEGRSHG